MKTNTALLLVLLTGCAQPEEIDENKFRQNADADTITMAANEQQVSHPDSKLYVWKVTPDYEKIRNPVQNETFLNADSLILGLNQRYENILLQQLKKSGDTIYTHIKDANYLTEQMGSTGAEVYLADVVLNLTSIAGIRYVHIELQEGSHMQPGIWSLDDFKKYRETK